MAYVPIKPNHDEVHFWGKDFAKLTEADLEPVGAVPVVGDVLYPFHGAVGGFGGVEAETVVALMYGGALTRSGRCPTIDWLESGKSSLRILKRKPVEKPAVKPIDQFDYYLSGPMTGKPDYNFPEFNRVAQSLRDQGHTVFNPAENFNGRTDLPRETYMRADIEALLKSKAIYLLDGWEESKGASTELLVALELGLEATDDRGRPVKLVSFEGQAEGQAENHAPAETILQEAQRLVGGDRGADYGHPLDDYNKTGMIWGALLHSWAKEAAKSSVPLPVPADLACLMMVGVKLSRHVNKRKRDNLVDGAGYLRCVEMCEQEQDRRNKSTEPKETQ